MSTRIEIDARKLKEECVALKQSFARSAFSIPVTEIEKKVTVSPVVVNSSGCAILPNVTDRQFSGYKVITFATFSGINALANLEPHGYRVPYSGGAQWVLPDWGDTMGEEFQIHIYAGSTGEYSEENL